MAVLANLRWMRAAGVEPVAPSRHLAKGVRRAPNVADAIEKAKLREIAGFGGFASRRGLRCAFLLRNDAARHGEMSLTGNLAVEDDAGSLWSSG
jgi:hypothetical protein